jgi:diguanylate cyclase (GGDEF)-like protein
MPTLTRLNGGPRRLALLSTQDVSRQQDLLEEQSVLREQCTLAQALTGSGHCVFYLQQNRQSWSAGQYRNFGLLPDDVEGDVAHFVKTLLELVQPGDRQRASAALTACIDQGLPFDTEWRVRWPDGSEHFLRVDGMRKNDLQGRPYAFVCSSLDLTDCRRKEEKLRQSQHELARAQQIARVGNWTLDLATKTLSSRSRETHALFGLDDENAFQVPVEEINRRIHPEDLPMVEIARDYCFRHPGTAYYVQYRTVPRPGELRYVESQAEVQTDADGRAVRMVGYLRDVTEARIAEHEIQRQAYHDELTGLPNRLAMRRQLERATSFDACDFVPLALLLIDVSRFRDIYLTLGHINADALLKDVSARILASLGQDVYLARSGGSQFAVILADSATYESLPYAQNLLKAFEAPFQVAGVLYDISIHIGIALFPGHAAEPVGLVRMANVAAYRARQVGTNMMMYRPELDPYKPERLSLLGEFRRAIQDGQIELYCQPKVDLHTNEVTGAEALVRWRHPRLGMISPALFVPLIEETELIHVLTRHMLQSAVKQCFNWQREGINVPLAVNISPRNLLSRDLPHMLETLLHTWGGTPDWLGLEITESSLITDPDVSIAELTTLSGMGFRLFVDDFGTGYSSLAYLTRLPVNVIKVDHGFTMCMLDDDRSAAIVKSTIELAHNLGMSVVAEGTASEEIWQALAGYGCDEAQGYFIAEPFPSAELGTWLRATGRHVRGHYATVKLC